jgi:hypothetical protein
MENLREQLIEATLAWERAFGNAPLITNVVSEYDAARLIGCSVQDYSSAMQGLGAAPRGHDFVFNGARYQVMGNRPSGKPGSFVTWVPKAPSYEWDHLIWILYNSEYEIQEAWQWDVAAYVKAFDKAKRLSPTQLRRGKRLAQANT